MNYKTVTKMHYIFEKKKLMVDNQNNIYFKIVLKIQPNASPIF